MSRYDFLVLIPPTTGVATYRAAVARDLVENYPEAIGPKASPLACRIEFFDAGLKRRDLDVLAEGVLEALIKAGVMKDDAAIDHLITSRSTDGPAGFVRVTLLELDDVTKNAIAKPFTLQPWADGSLQSGPEVPPVTAKNVNAKNWGLATWRDGSYRSYAEPAGGAKHWNPGPYFRPDHRGTPVKDSDHEGAIDAILAHANVANCAGVLIPVPWARIENAEGVYTWPWLDDRIDYITENGTNDLMVMLNLEMYSYGTSTTPSTPQSTSDAIVPDYVIDAGWCGDGNGIMPKIDVSGCRDRVINIMAQLVARYGNHPNVEMIGLGETSRDYVGINSTNYNNNWILIAEALVDQCAGKLAWGFIDHNGMLANDYAKVIQMADIMDRGDIAYSTADVIGFFSNAAAPPGVSISQRGNAALLARMNYGYSLEKNYTFTNGDLVDRRLWVPCKAEHQVVRPSALTNDIVRWYLDSWEKATHPVLTLRIGAGSVSYGTDLYGTSTPAPDDFDGDETLDYWLDPANAPARTSYPTGG